jgi:hypothetical protein
VHDPAKVVLDLAVTLALGGDCLADIALLRSAPAVFGPVASDPTVSRTVDALAADAPAAVAAIDAARAGARARAWQLAGRHGPDHDVTAVRPLVVDVDATLVTAHSEKEQAAPTFKRGFGFHPLWAFADHGAEGTGEPLSVLLRKGNAAGGPGLGAQGQGRRRSSSVPTAAPKSPALTRGRPVGRSRPLSAHDPPSGIRSWLSPPARGPECRTGASARPARRAAH